MSKTEIESRAGEGVSPAREVQEAVRGFVTELKGFRADIQEKLKQTEERLTMLDRKQKHYARPQLACEAATGAPHAKAMAAYLRTGDDDGLRGLELEGKALNTAVNADGGYLVDPVTSATVQSALNDAASLRSVATVVNVEATSYDVLLDDGGIGSGWASETAPTVETSTPQIERISIPLHELSALPKASQRLLDDAAFDIETWLAGRIADTFSRSEAAAFIAGDGVDKPRGFLDHPIVNDNLRDAREIGHMPSGVAADVSADGIIDVIYRLGAKYRANATFVMNSKVSARVRKLKDADGRFLWSDGLAANDKSRLMGYPVLIAEDMPDAGPGSHSIAFGDFAAGYTIAERPELRILRDPFSAKPHVLFYATKRVGGDVTDFDAIKILKFASS